MHVPCEIIRLPRALWTSSIADKLATSGWCMAGRKPSSNCFVEIHYVNIVSIYFQIRNKMGSGKVVIFDSSGRLDHWSRLRMALTLFILVSLWYLLRMWERPTMQFESIWCISLFFIFFLRVFVVLCCVVLCLSIAFAATRFEGSLFKKRRPNSSQIQFMVLKQSAIFVMISSEMQNWGSNLETKCNVVQTYSSAFALLQVHSKFSNSWAGRAWLGDMSFRSLVM